METAMSNVSWHWFSSKRTLFDSHINNKHWFYSTSWSSLAWDINRAMKRKHAPHLSVAFPPYPFIVSSIFTALSISILHHPSLAKKKSIPEMLWMLRSRPPSIRMSSIIDGPPIYSIPAQWKMSVFSSLQCQLCFIHFHRYSSIRFRRVVVGGCVILE